MMRSRVPVAAALALVAAASIPAHALTFEERVDAERALERVRRSHRGAAGAASTEASDETLAARVRAYLGESAALDAVWNDAVSAEALDAELRRIASRSRMPDRLREYLDALRHDPVLVRECLARPALVRRLARSHFAWDAEIHAEARAEAESIRAALGAGTVDPRDPHPRRQIVDAEADAGPARELGRIVETSEVFAVDAPIPGAEGRIARYVVRKRAWDEWWRAVAPAFDPLSVRAVASASPLPEIPSGPASFSPESACADGTWNNASLDDVPDPRRLSTAVWTGSEMVVWGGYNGTTTLDTGGRYDPAIDHWEPITTFRAPEARYWHTAVWTGSRMIVWGGATLPGGGATDTGHAYDPVADSWTAISTAGAPTPRFRHTAVWTGSRMIVWGSFETVGTGGRYDPSTDTWSPVSTTGAPLGRKDHTAVWTGSRMIVWGGTDNFFPSTRLNTGGRYDPVTDTWASTSTMSAPEARLNHSAVWTGTAMIVWGGVGASAHLSTGGIYDPIANVWAPTSMNGAPAPRTRHVAAWTGSRMLVWGGADASNELNTGGRYDPATAKWTPMQTAGAPSARYDAVAVWTGQRFVVWSGVGLRDTNTGGRYDPVADAWTPTTIGTAPAARRGLSAVWTGAEMIVWGGSAFGDLDTGGRYDPALDLWTPTATSGAPSGRAFHTAVWTGTRMVVWGGTALGIATGGRYDPVADAWLPTSLTGAPQGRSRHAAVWTGGRMVVWGGSHTDPDTFVTTFLDTGGRYDPAADLWESLSTAGAPAGRRHVSAVWTGSRAVFWGGESQAGPHADGGRYDPTLDQWTAMTSVGAPLARLEHTAVWSGSEMIVWGGTGPGGAVLRDGGRYDPVADLWQAVPSSPSEPSARMKHVAQWNGKEMLVWGGRIPGDFGFPDRFPNDGGRYDPVANAWSAISADGAPSGRNDLAAIWTGSEMVVWGGANGTLSEIASGGRYCACVSSTFYRDLDGDGRGDPSDTVTDCAAPPGYVADGSDCDDGNAAVWGTPGATRDLRFEDAERMTWLPPAEPGATSVVYDLLRSESAADFGGAATCVASNLAATEASDPATPSAGGARFYLPRAENGCPAGLGSLGSDSAGAPRTGRACP